MSEPTIFIVDRVVVVPGRARDFVDAYRDGYLPGAVARGYTLDRITMTPPVFLDDDSNTVTAVLRIAGAAHWWTAAIAGRHDPEPAAWWRAQEGNVVERTRTMEAAVDDVEKLCDV